MFIMHGAMSVENFRCMRVASVLVSFCEGDINIILPTSIYIFLSRVANSMVSFKNAHIPVQMFFFIPVREKYRVVRLYVNTSYI